MPVPHDARSVLACDPPEYGEDERNDERDCLLSRVLCCVAADVEGPNGECSGDGARKSELEFEDIETTQRHGEEYPDVRAAKREGDEAAMRPYW